MTRLTTIVPALALLALGAATPTPARAALGEPATSVRADREALRATRKAAVARAAYSVEELQVGSTTIREYVSSTGTVFAIAWNGLTHPDLVQLLGRYAPEYAAARAGAREQGRRRHQRHETDHLVVETWGHMRSLQGRAWVPGLVPPGVSLDDIS